MLDLSRLVSWLQEKQQKRRVRQSSKPSYSATYLPHWLRGAPEQRHSINEAIKIVGVERNIRPVDLDLFMRAYSVQIVDCDGAAANELEYAILADLTVTLIGAVR